MKLKLPSIKRTKRDRAPEPELKVEDSFFKAVWSAPANYNRAARRSVKLWGRIWKWDPRGMGMPTDLPARYARRHFDSVKFLYPKTRRQRRERARILRVARTPRPTKLLTLAIERRANQRRAAEGAK